MLVYVAVALAVALVLGAATGRRPRGVDCSASTLVCAYALATRLFPDRIDTYDDAIGYRLAAPVGYWNSLGLLAAIGVLARSAFVAHSPALAGTRLLLRRCPSSASTLYFTFSRGAWAALVYRLVATVALDPAVAICVVGRGRPGVCLAVAFASRQMRSRPSTRRRLSRARGAPRRVVVGRARRGVRRTGWLSIARGVVPIDARRGRVFDVALAVALLGVVAVVLVRVWWPESGGHRLEDGFKAPTSGGARLNKRLFSLSGNGRSEQLPSPGMASAHPLAERRGHLRVHLVRGATRPPRRARCALALHGDVRGARAGRVGAPCCRLLLLAVRSSRAQAALRSSGSGAFSPGRRRSASTGTGRWSE